MLAAITEITGRRVGRKGAGKSESNTVSAKVDEASAVFRGILKWVVSGEMKGNFSSVETTLQKSLNCLGIILLKSQSLKGSCRQAAACAPAAALLICPIPPVWGCIRALHLARNRRLGSVHPLGTGSKLFLMVCEREVMASLTSSLSIAGRLFQRRPAKERSYTCIFGVLSYSRRYYRGCESGATGRREGFFPLDARLGMGADRISTGVISLITRVATKVSFAQTALIHKFFFGPLSVYGGNRAVGSGHGKVRSRVSSRSSNA